MPRLGREPRKDVHTPRPAGRARAPRRGPRPARLLALEDLVELHRGGDVAADLYLAEGEGHHLVGLAVGDGEVVLGLGGDGGAGARVPPGGDLAAAVLDRRVPLAAPVAGDVELVDHVEPRRRLR